MNYLVHLYLSDPEPEVLLGNLMGDFVKGPLEPGRYPEGILRGLRQHRRVDAFAHDSAPFRTSRLRIDASFGHLRPLLVDIFYDHLLARDWDRFSGEPLATFAARVYRLLEANLERMPQGLQRVAPRMIGGNWLVSYRERKTVPVVLERLGSRLSRPNRLDEGVVELDRNYEGLKADCRSFLEQSRRFLAGDGA